MKKKTKPRKKAVIEFQLDGLTFSGWVDAAGSLILSAKKKKHGDKARGLSSSVIWGLLCPGDSEPECDCWRASRDLDGIFQVLRDEIGKLNNADLKNHSFTVTADKVEAADR